MKTFFASALVLAVAVFLSGCATTTYREAPVAAAPVGLSLAQIKEMSGRGVSDDTILSALRASRAVYKLTSKDVLDLQEAKVSQAVIDYLLSTVSPRPQSPPPANYRYYYYPPPYYYYPYPYWGFHWDFHPSYHHSYWDHHHYH